MNEKVDNTERIYAYLVKEWREHTRTPSYREIADGCELSLTTILYHLEKLEGQGRIVREPNKARSIRLVDAVATEDETTEHIYQFIRDSIDKGVVPTQTEIAEGCYVSRTRVRRYLARLDGQGRIIIDEGMRGIRLVEN